MWWEHFKTTYLIRFWPPIPAVIAAGILSTYYFGITGSLWAVTGEFTRWGGHLLQLLGVQAGSWQYFKIIGLKETPVERIDGVMLIAMFAGCFSAALWANNVKLRKPRHSIRIFQALGGGIIAGFGARLAMGCNLAAFFTGIPQFSLHAWLFVIASALGSYFGVKVTVLPLFRPKVALKKVNAQATIPINQSQANRRFYLGIFIFICFLLWAYSYFQVNSIFTLAILFGLAFGLLIERAQICFTSAFRDLWLTGRSQMAKAILLGMMVSTLGIFSYTQLGVEVKTMWAGPNVILGGLLFGFGIVVAGGCETGWMYRAMEGQVHYWWVGIGNIIGATLLAYFWDLLAPVLVLDYDKINLLKVFGAYGGLLVNYLLLFLAFIAVVYWERIFFVKRSIISSEREEVV